MSRRYCSQLHAVDVVCCDNVVCITGAVDGICNDFVHRIGAADGVLW